MSATEQPVDPKKDIVCCMCGEVQKKWSRMIANQKETLHVCHPCIKSAVKAVKDPKISGIKIVDFCLYRMLENAGGRHGNP